MQIRYHNGREQYSALYQKWNATTAACYFNKMICKNCQNRFVCQMSEDVNKYHIKQVKFATLQTFANIGKKGLEKFINYEEENNDD